MTRGRVGIITAIMMLALPFTSSIPWGYSNATDNAREVPLYFFTLSILVIFGVVISRMDKFLGWFIIYIGIRSIFYHTALALAVVHWITLAAFVLVWMRQLTRDHKRIVHYALIIFTCIEIVLGILQFYRFDPLWIGYKRTVSSFIHGLGDHHTLYGALVAILTPLLPWFIIPFGIFVVILSGSLVAFVALGAGLLWRYRRLRYTYMFSGFLAAVVMYLFKDKSTDTWIARSEAIKSAFIKMDENWFSLFFGYGIGSWWRYIPAKQIERDPSTYEVFYQGHNELIQLFFEGGLIALVLLACWLFVHRRIWTNTYSACLVALVITILGTFPLHVITSSAPIIVLVGLALHNEDH